jgi:membrane protease YdiL (CAAX protease family)
MYSREAMGLLGHTRLDPARTCRRHVGVGRRGRRVRHWVAGVTLSELLLGSASRTPIVGTLLILAFSVMVAVLVLAARRAGWSALSYFALVRPRGRYVLAGIVCVALPILLTFVHVQFDIREIIPAEQFGAARGRNILHLQFYLVVLSAVIAAPIMEEIMFRGFAYRGLSETRIGGAGTIVITSVVWAVIHINKGAAGIFDTAMAGIIWGWLRWYTGSLWVAIGAHMANNAIAVLMTVAAMYGLFG